MLITESKTFLASIILVFLCLMVEAASEPTIRPVPVGAPDTDFSGDRAVQLLKYLLPENKPHPTGSVENKKVKQRILAWLVEEGIDVQEQQAWGCHPDRGRCAWAENLIATIPGSRDGPYVALMSHYDSVAASPGAGDDGLGTAIIMEVARMIKAQGQNRNPLMLIITDAEENVLMGAEAFFARHPLAKEVAVVLNMEGKGSKGQSLLFRTSGGNADVLAAYRANSNSPRGASFAGELFKLLPSDTDMTVAARFDIPSADIGFSGSGNHHYHTIGDNTDNMDLTTAQYHGDNLYAIARGLIDRDLSELSEQVHSYDSVYGIFFSWPSYVDQMMLLVSFLALAFASRGMAFSSQLIWQSLLPVLIFLSTTLITTGLFVSLHFLRGETPFKPTYEFPYQILLFGTPMVLGLVFARWLNRRWEMESLLRCVWWFWWLMAIALTVWSPGAAYLLTLPVLFASVCLGIASLVTRDHRIWFYLLTLVLVVPFSLSKIQLLNTWQNYWLINILMPFFALFVTSMLPFSRGRVIKHLTIVGGFLVLVGAALSLFFPSYSTEKPYTLNYLVVQDVDKNRSWVQYQSFNAPPASVTREFTHQEDIYPWGEKIIESLSADVLPVVLKPLDVSMEYEIVDGKRNVDMTLVSQRNAMWLGMVIPQSSELTGFTIDGLHSKITPAWWSDWQDNYVVDLRGVQEKTIEVTLHFDSDVVIKAHVFEVHSVLPEQFQADLDDRAGHGVQIHDGDRFLSFREIEL